MITFVLVDHIMNQGPDHQSSSHLTVVKLYLTGLLVFISFHKIYSSYLQFVKLFSLWLPTQPTKDNAKFLVKSVLQPFFSARAAYRPLSFERNKDNLKIHFFTRVTDANSRRRAWLWILARPPEYPFKWCILSMISDTLPAQNTKYNSLIPFEREMFLSIYGLKVILLRGPLLNEQMVTYYIWTDADLPKSKNWTAHLKVDNIGLFCEEKNSVLLKYSQK